MQFRSASVRPGRGGGSGRCRGCRRPTGRAVRRSARARSAPPSPRRCGRRARPGPGWRSPAARWSSGRSQSATSASNRPTPWSIRARGESPSASTKPISWSPPVSSPARSVGQPAEIGPAQVLAAARRHAGHHDAGSPRPTSARRRRRGRRPAARARRRGRRRGRHRTPAPAGSAARRRPGRDRSGPGWSAAARPRSRRSVAGGAGLVRGQQSSAPRQRSARQLPQRRGHHVDRLHPAGVVGHPQAAAATARTRARPAARAPAGRTARRGTTGSGSRA